MGKNDIQLSNEVMCHFSHQRSLAAEQTTCYFEHKTRALTG